MDERLEIEFIEETELWKFIDPAEALLIASGINSHDVIAEYKRKLEEINRELQGYLKREEHCIFEDKKVETFRRIYEFVRNGREKYGASSPITLDGVIDTQRSSQEGAIGTCLGIANFIHVLGAMNGLELKYHSSINMEHIIPALQTGKGMIYVEPCLSEQFDIEPMEDGVDYPFQYGLAFLYSVRAEEEKDPYRKMALLRRALILGPESPLPYSEVSAVHLEYNGDFNVAKHFAKRAIEVDKRKHPALIAELGDVYRHMGRLDEARFWTQQALDLDPNCNYARSLMKLIS